MADFQINAGDDVTITGTVNGYTSIANFVITLGARAQPGKPPVFTKAASIVDQTAGTIAFTLVPSDTSGLAEGEYVYDIKIVDAGGKVVHTHASTFEIRRPVTP